MSRLTFLGDVQRLTNSQVPATAKFSQSDPQWWGDFAKAAQDTLDPQQGALALKAIHGHINKKSAVENYNQDCVMAVQDAIIPIQNQVEINPVLRFDPNSRVTDEDIHLQAMACYVPSDWRRKFFQDYTLSFSGSYARYCCGADGPGSQVDLEARTSRATWYTAAESVCWTDECELSAAGMFDLMRIKAQGIIRNLQMAARETFFYGDPEVGLVGLKDVPCERMVLPVPLDEMNWDQQERFLTEIMMRQSVTRGSNAISYNKALTTTVFPLTLNEKKIDTANAFAPMDRLGSAIAPLWQNVIRKDTAYMQNLGRGIGGRKDSPALFIYNDNPMYFTRLMPTGVIWLPPCEKDGMFTMQAIIKVGDVRCHDPQAGLMIENAYTPSDYN